jgi:hypothetical protein
MVSTCAQDAHIPQNLHVQKSRQFVANTDQPSITNRAIKIPSIFRELLGTFLGVSKLLTLSKLSCGTVARKHCVNLLAPELFLLF